MSRWILAVSNVSGQTFYISFYFRMLFEKVITVCLISHIKEYETSSFASTMQEVVKINSNETTCFMEQNAENHVKIQ